MSKNVTTPIYTEETSIVHVPGYNMSPIQLNPTIIDIRQFELSFHEKQTGHYTSQMPKSPTVNNNSYLSLDKSGCLDQEVIKMNGKETSANSDLTTAIIKGLTPEKGQLKRIPTMVLYDDKGLQIYDKITYLDEYYLVQEEIDILTLDSDHIVSFIPDDSVVVELGSGSLRKTRVLLDSLERSRKNIQYFALDLMRDELAKSLVTLTGYKNVTTAGLWGSYDGGMTFISSFGPDVPKTLLWLGSSIGNMTRAEATQFIANYRSKLNVGDNWLIGIDRRNSPEDITLAYNDPSSVTRDFIMNGLHHVNSIVQQDLFDSSKFTYFGRYNNVIGRHEAYYKALESHDMIYDNQKEKTSLKISVEKGELINVEYSYKWSNEESSKLFQDTKMVKVGQWASPSKRYDLHMVRKTPFFLGTSVNSSVAIPDKEEWEELWAAWDFVTMEMIGDEMLQEKPIDLRHPFIFYLGHIPTFLDIQLTKAFNLDLTEPTYFAEIFERGIDPDVDNPSKCHTHSTVPNTWPTKNTVVTYRNQVKARLEFILDNPEKFKLTRRRARILFMAFEHQAMHLETILYMLVQSDLTKTPKGVRSPRSLDNLQPQTWIKIDPFTLSKETVTLGHNDPESEDEQTPGDLVTSFGWDNEHPKLIPTEDLTPFEISSRQVTNGEYLEFLKSQNTGTKLNYPKSWIVNGEFIGVRTIFGPVSLVTARNWPVACSQKEAMNYIESLNSRSPDNISLPTEHQLSIAFKTKQDGVNGLMNENYGFKNWHPSASISPHPVDSLEWSNFQGPGALWDWTSTTFGPLSEGYVTSEIYPGYSADFFEGNHFVVLGASWATHPRIAERRTFRNWYQGNYEYAFIGFRMVRLPHL